MTKYRLHARMVQELIEYAGIAPIGVILGDRVTVYDFGDHAAIPLVCRLDPRMARTWLKIKGIQEIC